MLPGPIEAFDRERPGRWRGPFARVESRKTVFHQTDVFMTNSKYYHRLAPGPNLIRLSAGYGGLGQAVRSSDCAYCPN